MGSISAMMKWTGRKTSHGYNYMFSFSGQHGFFAVAKIINHVLSRICKSNDAIVISIWQYICYSNIAVVPPCILLQVRISKRSSKLVIMFIAGEYY
jgi:hypothetical protein